MRSFVCPRPPGSAPSTAARDVAALVLHDARCPGGGDCEGPVFEDYQRGDQLLAALADLAQGGNP